jgi:RNA polymerase sigma-70 factor (ECF subfamily)
MIKEQAPEELLDRIVQGDAGAFSELYDLYAPRVYGLIAHILPAREAAEDVLEEVFLRVWTQGASLNREDGSVAAWLVVTARAVAVERLRGGPGNGTGPQVHKARVENGPTPSARKSPGTDAKSLMRKSEPPKPRPTDLVAPAKTRFPSTWLPQPKEITLIDDRMVLLHKAIRQLPPSQRQALDLAVFRGRSESEIATEMGEPLGKAQRSLRAAVTFIKHRRRAVCGTWAANI